MLSKRGLVVFVAGIGGQVVGGLLGFGYLTGSLELLGEVLILEPPVAAFGGLLLSCIMVGATFTHLVVIGGSPVPALVLLALSAIVAYAKRSQFALAPSAP